MKITRLAVLATLLALVGCAGAETEALRDYAAHNWKYRANLYYKNSALTDDQKVAEVQLTGAAADVKPADVAKDLKDNGHGEE